MAGCPAVDGKEHGMFKRLIQVPQLWAKASESGDAGSGRRVRETEDGASLGSVKPGEIKGDLQIPPEGGGGGGEVTHAAQGDADLRGGGSVDPRKTQTAGQEGSSTGGAGGSQTGATSTGGTTGQRSS